MSNATPDAKGPQESSPETASAPADLIGQRPPGESPVGTISLIRLTLATLRFNFWRLIIITLYTGAVALGLPLLICCPLGLAFRPHPEWSRYLAWPILLPIVVPLMVGYGYAVLLQILGRRPKLREILRWLESWGLYLNVLAAGGLPSLAMWMIDTVASQLPWVSAETLLPAHPLVSHFLDLLTKQLVGIVVLPFAFAGLDALVRQVHFGRALARSLSFARRHRSLFAGFAATSLGFAATLSAWGVLLRFTKIWASGPGADFGEQGKEFLIGISLLIAILAGAMLYTMAATVIGALFYREFVWREREAGQTSAALLG